MIILVNMHSKIKVAMLNLYQMKIFHSLKAADSSSGSSSSSPPSPSLKYQHDDVCVPLVPWSLLIQNKSQSMTGVRLCRPIALSPQVTSPQPKLRRPNIGVVSPQHQSCVAQTRNFTYQVKVCKILRSIYANDRLIT